MREFSAFRHFFKTIVNQSVAELILNSQKTGLRLKDLSVARTTEVLWVMDPVPDQKYKNWKPDPRPTGKLTSLSKDIFLHNFFFDTTIGHQKYRKPDPRPKVCKKLQRFHAKFILHPKNGKSYRNIIMYISTDKDNQKPSKNKQR